MKFRRRIEGAEEPAGQAQLPSFRTPVASVLACQRHVAEREACNASCKAGADANIDFDDLRTLLRSLGFVERTRGSHYVFVRPGVEELLNLQRDGPQAKPYQVRQVRNVILKYSLAVDS